MSHFIDSVINSTGFVAFIFSCILTKRWSDMVSARNP